MTLEEHLVLKEADRRDYHLHRHAGTGQIRFKLGKRIVSYSQIRLKTTNQITYRVKSCT